MQGLSEEAYELYSKKAMVILKETSEQLKIQAEKARYDLIVIAKEIGGEKSPEPVKDIVEIFASSTDDVKEISNLHDFYLGIPYGILLSFGGFLSFMLTGSISAIRFGVILGETFICQLLYISVQDHIEWRTDKCINLGTKLMLSYTRLAWLTRLQLLRNARLDWFMSPSSKHNLSDGRSHCIEDV
ncbi:hypothetical protein CsSME_00017703 [Camellia sinensis var. sinensis]|uniref:Uncharacterized protein n=1 Tax=Camellia sinensis var. sinensis TaxID=542762 RepID=A0A4S4EWB2_CAMSN|nr:hypothetical protein TEA_006627 [Camellia sinensis var. sinensis]